MKLSKEYDHSVSFHDLPLRWSPFFASSSLKISAGGVKK